MKRHERRQSHHVNRECRVKITKIETIHLGDYPHLLFVAVHTDEGLVGYGDTFYMTDAVRGYIHEFAAPMLLGHDPLAIELHWRRLYEVIAHIAGKGAEIRGLSAIDVALWDIFGQAAGDAGLATAGRRGARPDQDLQHLRRAGLWPSDARQLATAPIATAGKYEDLIGFMTGADELALDLLARGSPA